MPPLSDQKYRPAIRLLVACARRHLSEHSRHALLDLLAGSLDWQLLLRQASRHALVPLLAWHLDSIGSARIPLPQLRELQSLAQAHTAKSLLLTAELARIDSLLRDRGVTSIPYKGPVLAQQAYGTVALRQFDDLDIILPQRDLESAHNLLRSLGYQPQFSPSLATAHPSTVPGEYKYYDLTRDVIVELHTERTLRHFPIKLDLHVFAQSVCSIQLKNGHAVHTFSPEHALPILCVHGSKDFWDRLSWIADISELIRACPGLDWDASFRFAESLRAERMFHIGLLLAAHLLAAPLPDAITQRLRRDIIASRISSATEYRILSDADAPYRSPFARLSYRRRMVAGLLPGWAYSLRLAFAPTVDEWLPAEAATESFHPASRPLRHFKKRHP